MLKFFVDAPENMVCSQAERFGRLEVLTANSPDCCHRWTSSYCAITFHGNFNICCNGETQVLPLRVVNISDEAESGEKHSLEIGLTLDKASCTRNELAEMDAATKNNEVLLVLRPESMYSKYEWMSALKAESERAKSGQPCSLASRESRHVLTQAQMKRAMWILSGSYCELCAK
eukprot:211217-Rhodomonas_salina.3